MTKKESVTEYLIMSGNERNGDLKEEKTVSEDGNLLVKVAMAEELKEMGLTENVISRQLNIRIKGVRD